MQIKLNIGQLREAVTQASYTLDTKVNSPGGWLRMIARQGKPSPAGNDKSKLYIYSTNLGLSRTLLKLEAEVTKEGEVAIIPKLLQSILASLPAEDSIELKTNGAGNYLQVKYETIESKIAVYSDGKKVSEVLQTFPFNAKSCTSVAAATLVDIINRTVFCTAAGAEAISEGPWLSSIHLQTGDGTFMGTATDRIIAGRAELYDGLVTGSYSVGIHRDALVALKALLSKKKEEEVTIANATPQDANGTTSNEVLFRFSDVILGVRQLASDYPKAVEKVFVVPTDYSRATINRKVLLNTLGRVGAFAEKNSFSASFAGSKVTLYTRGYSSVFEEAVGRTEKTEDNVSVGLGIAAVTNILSVMQGEEVVIQYKSDKDHVYFQEGDMNFKYVLSPVNLPWSKGKKE